MTYNWYLIFNLNDFIALGLESRSYNVYLEGKGLKAILVTKGAGVAVVVDDKFLPVEFNENNPWVDEDKAVYLDEDDNVWIGYEVAS